MGQKTEQKLVLHHCLNLSRNDCCVPFGSPHLRETVALEEVQRMAAGTAKGIKQDLLE